MMLTKILSTIFKRSTCSKKTKIIFTVIGKPPQKSRWDAENDLVVKYRKAALQAKTLTGLEHSLSGPVKLNLTIYAKNITDRQRQEKFPNDPEAYVGDLDNLVTGICEYLQSGPPNSDTKFSSYFKDNPEVDPKVEILIHDDAQFAEISAIKIKSKENRYQVEIEELTN